MVIFSNAEYSEFLKSHDLFALETRCDFREDSIAVSSKLQVYYLKSVKLSGGKRMSDL